MDKTIGPLLFLAILLLTSCGIKIERDQNKSYGQISAKSFIADKGEPVKIEILSNQDGEALIYQNDEKFQVKNEVVIAGFRNPSAEENSVLYWKHKFRECEVTERKITPEKDAHQLAEIELACKSLGQSVVYVEGSNFISRVVEYAKE